MREIKFKLWDTKSKTMLLNVQLGPKDKSQMITVCQLPGHITLQFSEFLDVDDKEIYEGDELSLEHMTTGLQNSSYWTVVFEQGMWMLAHGEQRKGLFNTLIHYYVRVHKSKYES